MTHIHLDPVGGVAGDMFVAALLDAFPDLKGRVEEALAQAGLEEDVSAEARPFGDGVLTGTRFLVSKVESAPAHDHHHHHHHTHWAALRVSLREGALPEGVKSHALGIFGELAGAEARVHGKSVEDVAFHEVGNWDSIADIVAASALIEALSPASWSIGSLPIGRGLVNTAHGELPVPAPATVLLLEGFPFHDDGRSGERVTPTGAAILRYLAPETGIGAAPRALRGSGHGFGARKLRGMSNILRALVFDPVGTALTDTVAVIRFEIDDQSGEELAVALDHIRAFEGVIDVTQSLSLGKKGRMMASMQVLAKPGALDAVCEQCFRQTTTLGLRTRIETRRVLARREVLSGAMPVKLADRPGGATAKTEMDSVATDANGHKSRASARHGAATAALEGRGHDH